MLMAAGAARGVDSPAPGEGFVMVPGGPVWYRVTGTGAGIPLLVLHGGPGGTSCGFAKLDPLGRERPVVRYDQLGTGRSGRPGDLSLWTVDRYVEELHEIRRQLGLQRIHLLVFQESFKFLQAHAAPPDGSSFGTRVSAEAKRVQEIGEAELVHAPALLAQV